MIHNYYGAYLLFCVCYSNSVSFIRIFCIYDEIRDEPILLFFLPIFLSGNSFFLAYFAQRPGKVS